VIVKKSSKKFDSISLIDYAVSRESKMKNVNKFNKLDANK